MTAIALVVSDLILVRILHLVIPSQYWYFSDHSLLALILYLGGLLLFSASCAATAPVPCGPPA